MRTFASLTGISFVALLALVVSQYPSLDARAAADEPAAVECSVYVSDMHCENCAKRLARKLYGVQGVVRVRYNVADNRATIVASAGQTISPKALWEAAEAAKLTPTKVVSPQGTFEAKPEA